MKLLILISLFLGRTVAAETWTCEKGEIRYRMGKEIFLEKSHYCYPETKNQLLSESCHNKNCSVNEAMRKIANDEPSAFYQEDFSPGHGVCLAIEGNPQFIEFRAGKTWHKLARCLLKDGSFVDTDWVLYLAQMTWKK